MSGGLRALRWRMALSLVGVGLVVAWVVMAGGAKRLVQIDFNMGREVLEGAVVRIDGDSVGTLQRYGRSQWVTGFEVDAGVHQIEVFWKDCAADADTVDLTSARKAVLMAEIEDGYSCEVVLR